MISILLEKFKNMKISILLIFCFLFRVFILLGMGDLKMGADSRGYLRLAKDLGEGTANESFTYLFQQLYSIVLSPIFAFSLPFQAYVLILHALLSVGTAWFIYLLALSRFGRVTANITAIVFTVYPYFVFWMGYVLTETLFLFTLSFYLWSFSKTYQDLSKRNALVFLLATAFFILARPSSLPVCLIGFMAIGYRIFRSRFTVLISFLSVLGLSIAGFSILVMGVLSSPTLQNKILSYPTVHTGIVISTILVTSDMDETLQMVSNNAERLKVEREKGSTQTIWEIRLPEALLFIKNNTAEYFGMALKRFTSYWFPFIYARAWSTAHRLIDFAIMLVLFSGMILLFMKMQQQDKELIFWITTMCLSFGILSAFSFIDTEGRYRLPAELILILLSTGGWLGLLNFEAKWGQRAHR